MKPASVILLAQAAWAALLAPAAWAQDSTGLVALAGTAATPPPPWRVVGLPAQSRPLTRFEAVTLDGERVLRVEAERSYANLVHSLPAVPAAGRTLSWRWRVDDPLPQADLRKRGSEDMALRVCALFDLPLAAVPFMERQVVRALRVSRPNDTPAASVCYVWDVRLPPGTELTSPFTRRIRYIVLRGPETGLKAWRTERRDLQADFLRLFGDESKIAPPLVAVAVGADADNTQERSLAYVDDLVLQ